MFFIRIEVNENIKHVSIYLSNDFEEIDPQIIRNYKKKKYIISKYISGSNDYSEIIQKIILNH